MKWAAAGFPGHPSAGARDDHVVAAGAAAGREMAPSRKNESDRGHHESRWVQKGGLHLHSIDSPDGTARQLADIWRVKFERCLSSVFRESDGGRSRGSEFGHCGHSRIPAFESTGHLIVSEKAGAVVPILGTMDAEDMDNIWRAKVEDAERKYRDNPTVETQAEYRRLVHLFADLVLRNQLPLSLE